MIKGEITKRMKDGSNKKLSDIIKEKSADKNKSFGSSENPNIDLTNAKKVQGYVERTASSPILEEDTNDTKDINNTTKDCRFNLHLTKENAEYLENRKWTVRKSKTQYINDLIEQDKKRVEILTEAMKAHKP